MMRKILKIFWFEYRLRVFTWRFFLGLLSGPLLVGLVAVFTVGRLSFLSTAEANAMGVVDYSGVIARAEERLNRALVIAPLYSFADETEARQALDEDRILGYYVFEPEFARDGAARQVLKRQGGILSSNQIILVMRTALLVDSGVAPEIVARVLDGASLDYVSLGSADGEPSAGDEGAANPNPARQVAGVVGAYLLQFIFFFVLNMVNGYVVRILLEERENRTLEVLVTSVDPRGFLGAKIGANVMVGLTQVVIWVGLAVAALILLAGSGRLFTAVGGLEVGLGVVYYLFGVLLVAGVNSTIASLVPKPQLASMLTGLVTLPTMIPFLATQALSEQPGSPLGVVLSMIPLTAIQTVPVRLFFAIPPWWEIVISLGLLAAAAFGALALAGWAFERSVRAGGGPIVRLRPFWRRTQPGGSRAQ